MSNRNDDGTFRGKQSKRVTDRFRLARFVESEVVRLKNLGMDFPRIAEQVTLIGRGRAKSITDLPAGLRLSPNYRISIQACHKAYRKAMRREPALAVEEHRRLDTTRLEEIFLSLQPALRHGDPKAVEAAIKVLAHKCKLLGLEAPKRMEMTGKDRGPLSLEVKPFEPPLTDEQRNARAIEILKILKEVGAFENRGSN